MERLLLCHRIVETRIRALHLLPIRRGRLPTLQHARPHLAFRLYGCLLHRRRAALQAHHALHSGVRVLAVGMLVGNEGRVQDRGATKRRRGSRRWLLERSLRRLLGGELSREPAGAKAFVGQLGGAYLLSGCQLSFFTFDRVEVELRGLDHLTQHLLRQRPATAKLTRAEVRVLVRAQDLLR
jgi:hypothetical protein